MLRVSMGDLRSDASRPQGHAMRARIVRPVSVKQPRSGSWMAGFAFHWRNGVHQRNQLGDIVAIRARHADSERNAIRVREDMMLRAFFAPIRRIGTGFVAPPTARSDELSTAARDQSILSAS